MRILTEDEAKVLKRFTANSHYREIIDNAPDELCRDYIVFGLIHGLYCGRDPVRCREHLEDGLTADDWRYIRNSLAGNNPFYLKCVMRIKEPDIPECPGDGR